METPRMTKPHKNPRSALSEIATAIAKLIADLEEREMEGRRLTRTEIDALARTLQIHVEALLAASRSLQDERLDG
jgi:hypothetical protein